jgi:hypothetical protein
MTNPPITSTPSIAIRRMTMDARSQPNEMRQDRQGASHFLVEATSRVRNLIGGMEVGT